MIKLFCVLLFCHKPVRYTLWVLAFIGHSCFSKVTDGVFPPLDCVSTHLNDPTCHNLVRVVTHADDRLIMYISWAVSGSYLFMEAVRMYSFFNRKTQQPVKIFFFKGLYFVLFHFLCLSLYDVYLECLYKFVLTESFIEISHLYNFAYKW